MSLIPLCNTSYWEQSEETAFLFLFAGYLFTDLNKILAVVVLDRILFTLRANLIEKPLSLKLSEKLIYLSLLYLLY
jgi:hypothetical protein